MRGSSGSAPIASRTQPSSVGGTPECTEAGNADTDAVIRGAAAWAIGRWITAGVMATEARGVLESRLTIEQDATVRMEIDAALASGSAYEA